MKTEEIKIERAAEPAPVEAAPQPAPQPAPQQAAPAPAKEEPNQKVGENTPESVDLTKVFNFGNR